MCTCSICRETCCCQVYVPFGESSCLANDSSINLSSHVNMIKYTCPRCSIHTCSLPCVKKHKQWAQCSGIRDPAEYRKRSDLETASSIDKDFNFITKVERSLQRADDTALARDLATSLQRRARPQEKRTKVEIEIEHRGVTVIRAPTGLTRHRQNKTHWANQHKCLMWTIEWVCPDGQKIVGQGLESKHVGEAFVNAIGKKNLLRKRKRNEQPRSLEFLHGKNNDVTTTDDREIDQFNRSNSIQLSSNTEAVKFADTTLPETDVRQVTETNTNHTSIDPSVEDHLAGLNFYLHRPNTSAQIKCLVHLRPNESIGKSLEKRTVLEFPTIYVKTEKPAQLSIPFVEEADYLSKYDTGTPVDEKLLLEEGEIDDAHQIPDIPFHESKVVEVLAKDLAGRSHV